MRKLSLDYDPLFGNEQDTRSTFDSDVSVFDYDIVFWDPEASFGHYASYADTYQGLPSLSETRSRGLRADVTRRRQEFKEFLDAGRVLVVVARPPQPCFVQTGEHEYSGTGRNARRTNFVEPMDIWTALPTTSPRFEKARGDRIEIVGDGPLQSLFRTYADHLTYAATMPADSDGVFARIVGTARGVASVTRLESGGLLLFVPDVEFALPDSDDDVEGEGNGADEWTAAAKFHDEFVAALQTLGGSGEVARPKWAGQYSTSIQLAAHEAVAAQERVVDRARQKLGRLQAHAEAIDLKDQLYLGTGGQLELQVKRVFEQLGAKVLDSLPGRDDLRLELDGTATVVEIKGLAKSAAEKHAAQLEKWVATSLEASGVMAKGVLVVNTWRDLPLADRVDVDFPAQMLPYSERRQHCLVTGLELFAISSEVEADPERAEHWRHAILATVGRLADVPDWRSFIRFATVSTET